MDLDDVLIGMIVFGFGLVAAYYRAAYREWRSAWLASREDGAKTQP